MSNFSARERGYLEKNFIFISLILHFCILIIFFLSGSIKNKFFGKNNLVNVEEIIRVDVVGLPTITNKEMESLKEEFLQFKKGENDSSRYEEKATSGEGLNLIQRLSKQSGVMASKKHLDKKSKGNHLSKSKKLKKLLFEGNKLSKGTSIKGRYRGDVAQFDLYVLNLPKLIRPFWKLPSYLKDEVLQARVIIYINTKGMVTKSRFISKSGNNDFDERAIKSINQSQPFPAPSEEIRGRLISEGVILGFPL